MSKYQICTNCVMDTTDPEITFDENGVCNHCRNFYENIKPVWDSLTKEKLDKLIEKIKQEGKNKEYDCVIGLSGGVDSSYLAYYLRKNYPDLRILAIHVDGGWNSELAVHNIENIVKKLDIDLHTEVINWEEMKDLQLAYFKSQLANQDVPQDHAFFATLYHTAVDKFGIKYFLSGSNYATESILPFAWGYDAMDGTQLKAIHKKFGKIPLKDYKVITFFERFIYYPLIRGLKIEKPLNYIDYHKDKAKEILMKEIDWRDYGGKHHESVFTKFFQSYWLPTKFGYDKRKAHLSSMILAGQITREEALKELEKPAYDLSKLDEDMEYLSKKLGLSVNEFKEIMSQPNKYFTDYPNEYRWYQLARKVYRFLKGKK